MDDGEADLRREQGRLIRKAYQKAGWTQSQLAERLGYDEKTVRNVIRGEKTRPKTLDQICELLNVDNILERAPRTASVAGKDLGGYSKDSMEGYISCYVAYRRHYIQPHIIHRSIFDISWDDDASCLRFKEWQRCGPAKNDFEIAHDGFVATSPEMNLLHLQSQFIGAVRLITLSKFKLNDYKLKGLVLTSVERDVGYQPGVAPIYLEKTEAASDSILYLTGPVEPHNAEYGTVDKALSYITNRLAILAWRAPVAEEEIALRR